MRLISKLASPLSVLVAVVCVLPLLFLALGAFRTRTGLTASPPQLLAGFTTDNFSYTYNGQSILTLIAGATVVAVAVTLVAAVVGLPIAYRLAQRPLRQSRLPLLLILTLRMAPPIAVSLPLFVLVSWAGIRGSVVAIVLAHAMVAIPFVVWFAEGVFVAAPREAVRAARVDGLTETRAIMEILFPATKPPLLVCSGFVFISSWNEYFFAATLGSPSATTVTAALPSFVAQATTQWGYFCAVSTISCLPPLIVVIAARKYLARAFSGGLLKDETSDNRRSRPQ